MTPRCWHAGHCGADGGWLDSSPATPPVTWLIHRRLASPLAGDLLSLLSPQEEERHYRFRRQEDRERFLLGRGVLRMLLAPLLGVAPSAVNIFLSPHGKPCLDPACSDSPLQFNVAHSGDLILLGFHPCRPVGVDLELQGELEWQPIARRVFPRSVDDTFASLAPADQLPAFYRHWCRLEAALKAQGTGFAADSLVTEGAVLHDLILPPHYCGSVAVL